ncbi:hypothetical protein OUZ56_028356 [Daphnia magna]|uniref:Acylphosphatase n=1 Tax=Daphnia magna TaxID=35525 RepID=A0ABR0B3M1_9CRUS|nr:hypothetical protein OUZ56_028356 [Daphnia magna]
MKTIPFQNSRQLCRQGVRHLAVVRNITKRVSGIQDITKQTFHMEKTRPSLPLVSAEFEIFGKVQGVFFRKYTRDQGNKLGLKGWCRNTEAGTVEGVMEGTQDQVNMMKEWLRYKGSPQSRIDKAEFCNEKFIESPTFTTFGVKK